MLVKNRAVWKVCVRVLDRKPWKRENPRVSRDSLSCLRVTVGKETSSAKLDEQERRPRRCSRCEKFVDPREVRESAFLAQDVSIESFLFGSHLTDRLIASFIVLSPLNVKREKRSAEVRTSSVRGGKDEVGSGGIRIPWIRIGSGYSRSTRWRAKAKK